MIRLAYTGLMGNNMLQYCQGRIMADKTGLALKCMGIRGFPNVKSIKGKVFKTPKIRVKHHIPVVPENPNCQIIMMGPLDYGLNTIPYEQQIKTDWLWHHYTPPVVDIIGGAKTDLRKVVTKNDILIHVRLGDLLTPRYNDRIVTETYWKTMLPRMEFDRLYIVSDSIRHEYMGWFSKYNPILIDCPDPIQTLDIGRSFDRIGMSVGTFSWWLSYFSDASKVYFPVPSKSVWSLEWMRRYNQDLHMPQSRYIYCEETTGEMMTYSQIKEKSNMCDNRRTI